MPRSATLPVVLVIAILAWCSPAVHALVDSIDATVTAEVQEYVGATAGDSDSAFEDLDETTGNLPLMAEVELFRTVDDVDEAGANATTIFYDPRLSLGPDPDEFSLDVGTFSRAPGVGYLARSQASETRQITFGASEIGAPDGSDLQASSQFFVDGLILVWGDAGQTDLSGTTAEMSLTVVQTRPGVTPTRVLQAAVTLTGQADGTAAVTTSGGLALQNISVLDLTNTAPDFGPLHLIVIPATTAIAYAYPAAVGEAFELKAEIQASARSQPMTGASVQLGVPLLELAALVNSVTGGQTGDLFEDLIQEALGSAAPAAKPLLPSPEGTTVKVIRRATPLDGLLAGPLCGLLGAESALLLTLVAGAIAWSPRRRR